jgi:GMP synthase-like glutamine amidotransferase
MNVYEEDRYPWLVSEKKHIERTIAAGKPVLGICLGAQLVSPFSVARLSGIRRERSAGSPCR